MSINSPGWGAATSPDDPRAVATRTAGYYLCADTDTPCHGADTEFCAHVWNWVRGWDAATIRTWKGVSALVDTDPNGLTAEVLGDVAKALLAAKQYLAEREAE
ncbi:hypothetical protein [Gordonia sp. (in: high G+C Gram-positive bacteria)]|uniref:hypothetical protein n=1 Tax=Gordonia sp. (in: high G+C Gram-positive bacteria) TaxID=84139 RepID=UPI003C78BA79